jgi:ribosomal protein L13
LADPVSWLMIEQGWLVVDGKGNELGRVVAVTGDDEIDIFDGLAVGSESLEQPRYVPSGAVKEIVQGCVTLQLTSRELAQLEVYDEPPPSVEIHAGEPTFWERLGRLFRGGRR